MHRRQRWTQIFPFAATSLCSIFSFSLPFSRRMCRISSRYPATFPMCFSLTSCAPAGSLQDQLRDFIGLRDEGQVTRFNLYGLGTHALGHESLEVRIDRAVLGRNGVIARL